MKKHVENLIVYVTMTAGFGALVFYSLYLYAEAHLPV